MMKLRYFIALQNYIFCQKSPLRFWTSGASRNTNLYYFFSECVFSHQNTTAHLIRTWPSIMSLSNSKKNKYHHRHRRHRLIIIVIIIIATIIIVIMVIKIVTIVAIIYNRLHSYVTSLQMVKKSVGRWICFTR